MKTRKISGWIFALCGGLLLTLLASLPAQAQYGAGIRGTVTDTSGAAVAGATVTVINDETNIKQQVTTSKDGTYSASALPPGLYTVTAEFSGFSPAVYTNVQVNAEATRGLNITLHPGTVKQQVTVTAQAVPALQTESATLSGALTSREITKLPKYGRDPYNLIRLTPGVLGDASRQGNGNSNLLPNTAGPGGSNSSIFQTENMVQISSAGQRISDNNFLLDGVSANSLTWGGAAVVTPNEASVKEVKVVTNGYSAEYGRNSGATVEVISQNGTNHFHGGGFFKYDSPGLNAYNKYNGVNNPPVRVDDATR
jgi:Carboxypeptidase regulatory-like domain